MPICYGCLQAFAAEPPSAIPAIPIGLSDDDAFESLIEEPRGLGAEAPHELAAEAPRELGAEASCELAPEAPRELALRSPAAIPQLRFHVCVPELFGYDIYLDKVEGAQLRVGCARDNDIVLPHTESRRHVFRLYCSQDSVWAQDKGSSQRPLLDGVALSGTQRLTFGSIIEAGKAKIELLSP
jgi:hypothetical protein